MKIKYEEGVYGFDLTVDGKDFFSGLSYDEQKNTAHKLVDKISEDELLEFVKNVVERNGDVTDDYYDEDDGEYYLTYELNIK